MALSAASMEVGSLKLLVNYVRIVEAAMEITKLSWMKSKLGKVKALV